MVTAGLGGMGGAQPLAVTMNGGVCLAIEVDETRIERRVETGYCDEISHDLDSALTRAQQAVDAREALSIGLVGNVSEVMPAIVERGVVPAAVTDQTSAHDLRVGYIPAGKSLEEGEPFQRRGPGRPTRARCSTR